MMKIEAHAKINTVLDVTGRRPDGYHEVDMVLQELSLHDDVELSLLTEEGKSPAGAAQTPFSCSEAENKTAPFFSAEMAVHMPAITVTVTDDAGAPIPGVPADEKNIAVKAAVRFFEELFRLLEKKKKTAACAIPSFSSPDASFLSVQKVIPEKIHIHLTKRIPAAAGLAGGSTDAAAVIKGLNQLLAAGFSEEKLCEIGLKVGADVPYCILGGTMRAQGIGEKLTRLPAMPKVPVLLVKPREGVSTKEIYEALDPLLSAEKEGSVSAIPEIQAAACPKEIKTDSFIHPDVDACIRIFPRTGTAEGLRELGRVCGNILERVTAEKLPVIKDIEKKMLSEGALCAMMSGSGPTVFGLFADETTRDLAAESFGSSFEIRKTETI